MNAIARKIEPANTPAPHLAAAVEAKADSLEQMTTPELRQELQRCLTDLAGHVINLAAIILALERKGDDLADLMKYQVLRHARRVAYGQLLPDAINRFQGSPLLLERVASLPIPDQERVSNGDPIPVVVLSADGHVTKRLVPPSSMSRSEIAQVFAGDHMRDEGEQVSWLRDKKPKPDKAEWVKPKIKISKRRGGIIVKGKDVFIPTEELREYIKQLDSK